MITRARLVVAAATATLLAFAPMAGRAERISGPLVITEYSVTDGDTIRVVHPSLTGRANRIRIRGLDTPETFQAKCAAEKRRGDAATTYLRRLLAGRRIVLVAIDTGRDRYGRSIADVMVGDPPESAAQAMIAAGHARRYHGGQRQPWCP